MTELGLLTKGFDVGGWTPAPEQAVSDIHGLDCYREDVDLPRLIAALQRIDSDNYKSWNTCGLALKNAGDYYSVWEWWSKLSPKSKECDLPAEWEKLKPNGSVTLGTIFHLGKVEDGNPGKFETYTYDQLQETNFDMEYLIEGILVDRQPSLCVGPQKSLKTTLLLNMALSLATGTKFLGKKCKKSRVLLMSGESGPATLQETAARQLKSMGCVPDSDYFHLSLQLPRFDRQSDLDELEKLVAEQKTEVLIIDPAYLCMDGSDANSMFKMGQQLKNIADVCTRYGITFVLAHHCTKSAGDVFSPLELSGMAWSGFGEFARQWLLLSRRERYVDGTGEHKLFLRAGGSAGHSNLFNLDISEGVYPNRHWQIDVKSGADSVAEATEQQYQKDVAKIRRVLAIEPKGKTKMRNMAGINSKRWQNTFDRMFEEGVIQSVEIGGKVKFTLGENE